MTTRFRIGFEADFAPLTFVEDAEARGLVIEVLTLAFERTGQDAAFIPVPLPDQENALDRGDIDAIAFKAVIPDRAGSLAFSAPIAHSGGAWFSTQAIPAGGRPDPGARVATPGAGPLLAPLRRDYPDLIYPEVDTYAESLSAVMDGAADCAALNFHVGRYLAGRDHPGRFVLPTAPFEELALALAVPKGTHATLLSDLDSVLSELRGSGALAELEARWIGG